LDGRGPLAEACASRSRVGLDSFPRMSREDLPESDRDDMWRKLERSGEVYGRILFRVVRGEAHVDAIILYGWGTVMCICRSRIGCLMIVRSSAGFSRQARRPRPDASHTATFPRAETLRVPFRPLRQRGDRASRCSQRQGLQKS
jgi:hypothetical protein